MGRSAGARQNSRNEDALTEEDQRWDQGSRLDTLVHHERYHSKASRARSQYDQGASGNDSLLDDVIGVLAFFLWGALATFARTLVRSYGYGLTERLSSIRNVLMS